MSIKTTEMLKVFLRVSACIMSIKIIQMLNVLTSDSVCMSRHVASIKITEMLMVLTFHNVCTLYLVNKDKKDVSGTYLRLIMSAC